MQKYRILKIDNFLIQQLSLHLDEGSTLLHDTISGKICNFQGKLFRGFVWDKSDVIKSGGVLKRMQNLRT